MISNIQDVKKIININVELIIPVKSIPEQGLQIISMYIQDPQAWDVIDLLFLFLNNLSSSAHVFRMFLLLVFILSCFMRKLAFKDDFMLLELLIFGFSRKHVIP
jgi:hypothetical protein